MILISSFHVWGRPADRALLDFRQRLQDAAVVLGILRTANDGHFVVQGFIDAPFWDGRKRAWA
jgi:hypothetical protein